MTLKLLNGYLPENQVEIKNAVLELREVQENWKSTGEVEKGWSVEVEPKFGLTIWRKDFGSFFLHEDRGGTLGWSINGESQGQFRTWM